MTAFLLSTSAFAQNNIHFIPVSFTNYGTETTPKVWSDMCFTTDNSTTYGEIQKALNQEGNFYIQLFHEQKFWDVPVYIHTEYRAQSSVDVEHILMVGAAFTLGTENGYIAIEPLCRVDGTKGNWGIVQPMMSVVSGHDWDVFNLNTFTDFWYDDNFMNNGFNWYSELWSYFNVYKYIELGAVTQFAYSGPGTFFAGISPALKIKF